MPAGFTIRPMRAEDTQAVYTLHTRAVNEVCAKAYTPQAIKAWNASRTPQGYLDAEKTGERFLVAVLANEEPIAFIGWKDNEIKGLYVNPDYHGQGIGSALVHAAEADAASMGQTITCLTATLNAQSFYEKHGFSKLKQDSRIKNGAEIPQVHMTRP